MTKILCTILVSIIITAAVAYFTQVIIGETGVKILEIQHDYAGADLIAVVMNDGKVNVTIRGYEVFDRAKNGAGKRWNQSSVGDIEITLAPGETQSILLGSRSAPSDSQDFKVRLYVMNNVGGKYTITWEGDR